MNGIAGLNIDTARRQVAARFKAAGLETPELDARILIGAILKLDQTELSIQSARTIAPDEADEIEKLVIRRLAREPVARVLGCKEFWGLNFRLSEATLVPRPDTETVVTVALEYLRRRNKISAKIRIADIGTGSGAILLALLSECPNAYGIGTDISDDALVVASINAKNLDLAGRTTFVKSNYADALSDHFDLIVSNPPYIRSTDIERLDADVRDYDPRLALDGGEDGLDAYRLIAPGAAGLLLPDGALIVEVGHDQATAVSSILQASGLTPDGPPAADLGGHQRVITGRKHRD